MVGFETCGPNEAIVVSGIKLSICSNFALNLEINFEQLATKLESLVVALP